METIEARLTEIESSEKTPCTLGISYGIATFQKKLFNSVEAFISADSLMYRNKSVTSKTD